MPTEGRADYPAFSPGGQRLALTRYGPWGAQIWTQYLDGSAPIPVTRGPRDTGAAWAPDGTEVAFTRGRAGTRDIWRVLSDGTGLVRVTRDPRDDSAPSWSVSDTLAFARMNRRGSDIYAIAAGGGAPRRLTKSPLGRCVPGARTGRDQHLRQARTKWYGRLGRAPSCAEATAPVVRRGRMSASMLTSTCCCEDLAGCSPGDSIRDGRLDAFHALLRPELGAPETAHPPGARKSRISASPGPPATTTTSTARGSGQVQPATALPVGTTPTTSAAGT